MAIEKQFEMSVCRFRRELRLGCIRLQDADSLSIASAFVDVSAAEITLSLFANYPRPWEGLSLLMVSMYKLPRGKAAYQEELQFFSASRKARARLPEGARFEPSILEISRRPTSWIHEAFARSGRDFIHTYQSADRAMLVRFLGKAGTIRDNPLFAHVQKNLSIVENQWVADLPQVRPVVPQIVDGAPARDARREIDGAIRRARERLQLDPACDPHKVAAAIHRQVEHLRNRKRVTADERTRLAIDLGALWGDTLCRANKWEWRCVKPDAESEIHAVCSTKRSHAVDPIRLIHRILSSRRTANNALLLFNMITADKLPHAPERAFSWLE